MTSHIETVH